MPADEPELAAVGLCLTDGRRVGWVATGDERASDWFNARHEVPIRGLVAGEVSELLLQPAGPLPESTIARDEIVWVVPPPLPPNRHLKLHRRRILVHLELDEYDISGQVHVRPGADAVDQVLRGTRDVVPLTEVQLALRGDPAGSTALPVLLVNRRHVRRVVEDAAHMSGPVAEPVESGPDPALDPRIAWLVPDAPPAAEPEPVQPADAVDGPAAADASGLELLHSALELLLEAGIIDVVEFQSIRARIPSVPTD